MESDPSTHVARPWHDAAASLTPNAAAAAAAAAADLAAALRQIEAVLRPMLGSAAVAAMLVRSVRDQLARRPWLDAGLADAGRAIDITGLEAALAAQPPQDALGAGDELLHSFRRLLVSLIGALLTDRLLSPVWDARAPSPPTQEPMT